MTLLYSFFPGAEDILEEITKCADGSTLQLRRRRTLKPHDVGLHMFAADTYITSL